MLDASVAVTANLNLVNEARASLLRSGASVTIAQIAAATGRSEAAVRGWAARERDAGRLVLVPLHDGMQVVPTVQLDEGAALDEAVADRTRRLVEWGMGPWASWHWWEAPNGWLDAFRSPADAIRAGDLSAVDRALDGLIQ